MAGFKDLDVWQLSMKLAQRVYLSSSILPTEERFGIQSQIRRAAVSIPCNIAEGYGRRLAQAQIQFYRIAKGSLNELETLLILSRDLGYVESVDEELKQVAVVGKKLSALIASIDPGVIREEVALYAEALGDRSD